MCLFSFASVYFWNVDKNELLLHNLSDSIPVPMHVTNPSGMQDIGLEITPKRVEALLSSGIRETVYTAQAAGNLKLINRVEHVRSCDTAILGVNDGTALSKLDVMLIERKDLSFLARNAAECLLSHSYAQENGLGVGDTGVHSAIRREGISPPA